MRLQLLIGMIASGKSTYARNAAKSGVVCVNDDDVVTMIHGGDYTMYDANLKLLYKSIEINAVITALSMKKTVVIDRGLNISKKSRQRWISLAASMDIPCDAIVFPIETPEIHASRRFESCPRGLTYQHWLDAARRHYSSWVPPTESENFSRIYSVRFEQIQQGYVAPIA